LKKRGDKTLYYGLYFLGFVILLYIILYLLNPNSIYKPLNVSLNIFIQIIPVIIMVIVLMGFSNYFLKPKIILKYLGRESGTKGWILAIVFGIVSHGSIYVWYPFLKDLHKQGMKTSLIAVFLYNRAIKIPLLPIMIFYFGIPFVIVLMIYMILASVIEGKVLENINGGSVEDV